MPKSRLPSNEATIVRKRLKGKVKRVQLLQSAWRTFKTMIIEAQPACILQRRKGFTKLEREQAWLTSQVRETIKTNELPFIN